MEGFDWISLGRDLGLTALIVSGIGVGVWRVVSWCGPNVVKPIVERHLRWLDKFEQTNDHIGVLCEKTSGLCESTSEMVKSIVRSMDQQTQTAAEHLELTKSIHESHVELLQVLRRDTDQHQDR